MDADLDQKIDEDYDKPVAYDADGRPLYAHPPVEQSDFDDPKIVNITRPITPKKPVIDAATQLKHKRSVDAFPDLNLSEGEYIISAIRRHPIGLFAPMALGVFCIIISGIMLANIQSLLQLLQLSTNNLGSLVIIFPTILFMIFVALMMYMSYYVYTSNRFFLTNESIIQEIQTGLFSKREQTVSLLNIEDASYSQNNIINHIFDYGSIRLSTEGDETTYRFSYVSHPKENIAILNNAVEAFKNGRPIDDD